MKIRATTTLLAENKSGEKKKKIPQLLPVQGQTAFQKSPLFPSCSGQSYTWVGDVFSHFVFPEEEAVQSASDHIWTWQGKNNQEKQLWEKQKSRQCKTQMFNNWLWLSQL